MSGAFRRTNKPKPIENATMTCEGPIPHEMFLCNGKTFYAPVCLVPGIRGNDNEVVPYRRDGKLIFALPGGRTFSP